MQQDVHEQGLRLKLVNEPWLTVMHNQRSQAVFDLVAMEVAHIIGCGDQIIQWKLRSAEMKYDGEADVELARQSSDTMLLAWPMDDQIAFAGIVFVLLDRIFRTAVYDILKLKLLQHSVVDPPAFRSVEHVSKRNIRGKIVIVKLPQSIGRIQEKQRFLLHD